MAMDLITTDTTRANATIVVTWNQDLVATEVKQRAKERIQGTTVSEYIITKYMYCTMLAHRCTRGLYPAMLIYINVISKNHSNYYF
jgi:hypothetical protein